MSLFLAKSIRHKAKQTLMEGLREWRSGAPSVGAVGRSYAEAHLADHVVAVEPGKEEYLDLCANLRVRPGGRLELTGFRGQPKSKPQTDSKRCYAESF